MKRWAVLVPVALVAALLAVLWAPDPAARGTKPPEARTPPEAEAEAAAATLRGRLRWADGTPARGTVRARDGRGDTVATDADGRFVLDTPPGLVVVEADVPDHAHLAFAAVPSPGDHEFVLDAGARTIEGRVVRAPDHTPIGGALVRTRSFTARTDANGRFAVKALSVQVGEFALTVDADGYAHVEFEPLTIVDPIVLAPLARLEGRAFAGGQPAARFDLRVRDARGVQDVRTDDAGRFAAAVQPGEVSVGARGWGVVGARAGGAFVAYAPHKAIARPGETAHVEVRFEPRAPTPPREPERITVLDARTDAPVAGAVVFHQRNGRWVAAARTDAAGTAPYDRPTRVTARGYVPQQIWRRETVRLQPGRVAHVRVLGPDGAPVVRARVAADGAATTTNAHGDAWLTVAEDGRVSAGHGRLSAEARVGADPTVLRLTAGEAPAQVDFQDERADEPLVLRVVDPDGRPVLHGRVRVKFHLAQRLVRLQRGGWDYDKPIELEIGFGRVQFDERGIASAKNRVSVEAYRASSADGAPLPFGPTLVPDLPAIGEHVLRLPPERRASGSVHEPDGTPVGGVLVWAFPWDRAPGRRPRDSFRSPDRSGWYDRTRTAPDGTFTLRRLGDAPVAIVVEPPPGHLPPGAVRADSERPNRIVLESGARARIRVTDADGEPVAGARVTPKFTSWNQPYRETRPGFWWREDAWRATTDANGFAVVAGLEPGRAVRLQVRPPRGRDDLSYWENPRWTPRDTDVALAPSGVVTGRCVDEQGRPVQPQFVTAVVADGSTRYAKRGRDGTFRFEGLPTGELTVSARHPGASILHQGAEVSVRTRTGAPPLTIVLPAPPGFRLRVAPRPEGPAIVELHADRPTTNRLRMYLDEEGEAEIIGMDPEATYAAYGRFRDGTYVFAEGLKTGPDRVTLPPRQGHVIRGRVIGAAPGKDVSVFVQHDVVDARARVEAGTFEIRGVPPGTWTVVAWEDGGRRVRAEVEAGGTVDLTLR